MQETQECDCTSSSFKASNDAGLSEQRKQNQKRSYGRSVENNLSQELTHHMANKLVQFRPQNYRSAHRRYDFGAQKTQEDNKLDENFHKINANQANANSYQHANRKKVNNRSWTNHKRRKFAPTKGYGGVSANNCLHRAHLNLPKGQHQWSDCCHNPR